MAITAGGWRVWLQRLLDPLIALLVFAVSLSALVGNSRCGCPPTPVWGFGLLAVQCVPLALRRRWPFATALVCGLATVVYSVTALPEPAVPYAGLVAVYSAAAHASRRLALAVAGATVVSIAVALALEAPASNLDDAAVTYLLFTSAWLLGNDFRNRRERTVELEERAAALERTRTAEAARAVVQERNRIARDMHDVVAHHVSMMVVQAEAGPVVLGSDPARAAEIFEIISASGKQALQEMRRLLGVLRSDPGDRLAPQPGLERLPELIGGVQAAGVTVQFRTLGEKRELPPAVDLSAFRVLQEALTNVLRHAAAAQVSVLVEYRPDGLYLEVVDDGGGAGGDRVNRQDDTWNGGHGLVAMRERVGLVGGSVAAGPRPDGGGWAVSASLPLDRERARMQP